MLSFTELKLLSLNPKTRGILWIENHSDLFKKDDLIIIPDAGEPDGSMIEVAEKSILWVKFKTIGKQVHASIPDLGVNAFRAASNLVVKLEDLHIYNVEDEVFAPSRSTFEPTKKEANVPNVNTIPGDDVFFLDCHIIPEYNIKEVLGTIRGMADKVEKSFNVKIEISMEQKEQAAVWSSLDDLAHQPNEYCNISDIRNDVRIFALCAMNQ